MPIGRCQWGYVQFYSSANGPGEPLWDFAIEPHKAPESFAPPPGGQAFDNDFGTFCKDFSGIQGKRWVKVYFADNAQPPAQGSEMVDESPLGDTGIIQCGGDGFSVNFFVSKHDQDNYDLEDTLELWTNISGTQQRGCMVLAGVAKPGTYTRISEKGNESSFVSVVAAAADVRVAQMGDYFTVTSQWACHDNVAAKGAKLKFFGPGGQCGQTISSKAGVDFTTNWNEALKKK